MERIMSMENSDQGRTVKKIFESNQREVEDGKVLD
jgi:hypothetical protein